VSADRGGDAFADARQRAQARAPPRIEHRPHRLFQPGDRVGGAPVGVHPERVRALVGEERGSLPQLGRDTLVLGFRIEHLEFQ
jgi:hypothetical protein